MTRAYTVEVQTASVFYAQSLILLLFRSIDPLLSLEAVKHAHTISAVGVEPCTGRLYFSGGGVCIEKSIRGGGGSELSDQLLDPDVPTLASQDKLKVSPKGLPFVIIVLMFKTAPSPLIVSEKHRGEFHTLVEPSVGVQGSSVIKGQHAVGFHQTT